MSEETRRHVQEEKPMPTSNRVHAILKAPQEEGSDGTSISVTAEPVDATTLAVDVETKGGDRRAAVAVHYAADEFLHEEFQGTSFVGPAERGPGRMHARYHVQADRLPIRTSDPAVLAGFIAGAVYGAALAALTAARQSAEGG